MSSHPTVAQVEAARAYEALFVPAVFGPLATQVAAAIAPEPGARVLDVACGTGALARALLAHVGPHGRVEGIDADAGMLAVARENAPGIEWHAGMAESLPHADASLDAVASQFGLMFFGDRTAALREAWRVLRPGGRLAVAVFDALPTMPAFAAEVDLLQRRAGTAAADALRAPFVLGDRSRLASLFTEAGIDGVEFATLNGTARFPSIRRLVEADLRGWLPVMGVHLDEPTIAALLEEAEHTLAAYAAPDGVEFALQAHLAGATRPEVATS